MDKSIKGSQTEKNLLKAFAGESQARNRYTFFAKAARNEGYQKIALFFEETARNEEEHSKLFFKQLEGGSVEITASYPAGIISNTLDNLKEAEMGEEEEWKVLYPAFAKVAKEEGYIKPASLFTLISEVENQHRDRFAKLWEEVKNSAIFTKPNKTVWRCLKCGHQHSGTLAPQVCPICGHPQAYFEVVADVF
ncbi:MAG: rubrerythrin family protein [Deltaproteobacteria bacterium]|jgi:rubrerythrin|nr:rubrerythrin family protein [Deltaproteobacteria bacterium]